jgi:hypothetical protein
MSGRLGRTNAGQFLAALPLVLRSAWSKRCAELLSPKGRLVCLEFPRDKPASAGGPPWALPSKIYMAHLSRPGEALPYSEEGGLLEDELGPSSRNGLQRIEYFKSKRTLESGYNTDGEIADWVSVWARPV